jgi:hypothetical protein
MPSIRGQHNHRAAYVTVTIIDDAGYQTHRQSASPVLQGARPYRALIDTGATGTALTRHVVAELGLLPVGKRQFGTPTGIVWQPYYLVRAAFYDSPPEPGSTAPSRIRVYRQVIEAGEIQDQPSFDVLLGMDVITSGRLVVDRDGSFEFSY